MINPTNFHKVFQGTAFTSKNPKEVTILTNHLFCVSETGNIQKILAPEQEDYSAVLESAKKEKKLYTLEEGQFILPGFIDLHIHAPQFAQIGTALDKPLYDWLNEYTFPLEAKFKDLSFAKNVYTELIDCLLANGTTTGLFFATVHKEASVLLAKICAEKGQRGLVGKVVMDDSEQNPEYCRDTSTEIALQETEEFILELQKLGEKAPQGIYPVITPRFIPSCTDEALDGLGKLAQKYQVHVQSHCSESDWEHNFVFERFGKSDTEALQHFGLLTEKSVMAHCGFLSDKDMDIFAQTGTAVAHCPISNGFFGNTITPVAKLHEHQVEVGVGTDISGGYAPSLYENIRQAVLVSQILNDGVNKELPVEERGVAHSRISLQEAFYLATAGGGESLDLPIGQIKEGFVWDIQIVEAFHNEMPLLEHYRSLPLEDVFQKILYLTSPAQIKQVWIQGQLVHTK